MRKLIALTFIVFMMLFVACDNSDNNNIDNSINNNMNNNINVEKSQDSEEPQLMVFDASSLSAYNGKDGNPTYIAIEGVVYDVSDQVMWMDGIHQGRFEAGQDLTTQMKSAPHGFTKLNGLKEVGSYED